MSALLKSEGITSLADKEVAYPPGCCQVGKGHLYNKISGWDNNPLLPAPTNIPDANCAPAGTTGCTSGLPTLAQDETAGMQLNCLTCEVLGSILTLHTRVPAYTCTSQAMQDRTSSPLGREGFFQVCSGAGYPRQYFCLVFLLRQQCLISCPRQTTLGATLSVVWGLAPCS